MKRPVITVKFAQTFDGKIAAGDGSSKWISSPESLKLAHRLRSLNDAILIGAGTLLSDNPSLTTRRVRGSNPIRVVIDRKLKIPYSSNVLKGIDKAKTIIITTKKAAKKKIIKLEKQGAEVVLASVGKNGYIDLNAIIRILYKKGVKKLLVEGGSKVITSFIRKGLADKIVVIVAPKILGKGMNAIGDLGISSMNKALKLKVCTAKRSGKDVVYEVSIKK